MDFINYFFASLISFSGLIAGMALISIAPEEKKPMVLHFRLLRYGALFLVVFFSAFFYIKDGKSLLTVLAYAAFILLVEWKNKDLLTKEMLLYSALGIIFWMSSVNQNLFVIVSALIFLHGTAAGSLLSSKKNIRTVIFCSGFLILANALFFL